MVHVLNSFCDLSKIMRENFVDPLGWHRSLKVPLPPEQRQLFFNFPWDLSVLEEPCPFTPGKIVAETHLLFWGFPHWTIRSLMAEFSSMNPSGFLDERSLDRQVFREALAQGWHLMPLQGQCVFDAEPCIRENHLAKLPSDYALASAVEEVAKQVFYYLVNRKCPFEGVLYDYEEERETYNPLSKTDPNQPKFVKKAFPVHGVRHLYLRCSDQWSENADTVVGTWHPVKGMQVLPFPHSPAHTFPVALSLRRNYTR